MCELIRSNCVVLLNIFSWWNMHRAIKHANEDREKQNNQCFSFVLFFLRRSEQCDNWAFSDLISDFMFFRDCLCFVRLNRNFQELIIVFWKHGSVSCKTISFLIQNGDRPLRSIDRGLHVLHACICRCYYRILGILVSTFNGPNLCISSSRRAIVA